MATPAHSGRQRPKTRSTVKNILFIMCDQLRWDALSCSGHSVIDTPNIDSLAQRGVRFDRAYVQGAVCGSSRMSYYTGRYVQSHGARWNRVPLTTNQRTLGDHLRPHGVRTVLVGKTHFSPDRDGLARLGLDPDAPENVYLMECGFEPTERDDGIHPDQRDPAELAYNRFLRSNGFDSPNPWHSVANSVTDEAGNLISGWLLRSSAHPAIVPDELSETAYMVDRAISFMTESGQEPWCMHLSFIKPHWPYVVSEPYHQLVDASDLPEPVRHPNEQLTEHPVLRAFQQSRIGSCFSRDEVRRTVYPAYLGLVKQIDVHLGRLLASIEAQGLTDETMIVFTSDHGDYLGDHWMGEKDWFHDQAVKVPLIVVDPRLDADATRGTVSDRLVEAIDLVPTFVDAVAGDLTDPTHDAWLEGRSLIPTVHDTNTSASVDDAVFCETDFSYLEMSHHLPEGTAPEEMRATMMRTDRYKYILSETGPNLLYDLGEGPDEFENRAADPALATIKAELHDRLFAWYRQRDNTVTGDEQMRTTTATPGDTASGGIVIGFWDEDELAAGIAGTLF